MPTSAPKPCTVCSTLVRDGTSRCEAHKVAAWSARRPDIKRTTGRKLQRQRHELFMREPLCRECERHGRVRQAEIRDHIVPLAEGGADEDSNIQSLCRDCHDEKTAGESKRGRGVANFGATKAETDPQASFLRTQVIEGGGVKKASPEQTSALDGVPA